MLDLPDNGIRNHAGTDRKLAEPFSFLVGSVFVGAAEFAVVAVRLGFEVDGAVAADRGGGEGFFYGDEFGFGKEIFFFELFLFLLISLTCELLLPVFHDWEDITVGLDSLPREDEVLQQSERHFVSNDWKEVAVDRRWCERSRSSRSLLRLV